MHRPWNTAALTLVVTVLAGSALAQVAEPQPSPERLAIAEQVIAREETASERAFDPAFRAKAKALLAGLAPEQLAQVQAQPAGLGLNVLGDTQADLVYTPVVPCRIIDTRKGLGAIAANTTHSFNVTGDTTSQGGKNCSIPYGPATAAVINFVAVGATAPGDLRVTPYGSPMPLASILNWAAVPGLAIANGLAVALCNPGGTTTCTNDITLQADASAIHIVADVLGYYENVGTGGVGTALLADGAVTAPKIASGAVVRSLNSQTDAVTLAGSNGLGVTAGSGTVTVNSNATDSDTPGAIVSRDGSGNFSAGTITANLNGNAATATGFSGVLAGEVVGTQGATLVLNAVPPNTANSIVRRDQTGSFWAGSINLAGNLTLPNTSVTDGATAGAIFLGSYPFLHNYGGLNTFVGQQAGNTNLTGNMNTAAGAGSLMLNTEGAGNTAIGYGALLANTTGNSNLALGQSAGGNHVSGDNNVFIAASGPDTESGSIRIGTPGQQTTTYIAGVYGEAIGGGSPVYINSSGQLGVGPAGGGTITAVNTPSGGGLQGGTTSGAANLGLVPCPAGQLLKSAGSSWSCGVDIDTNSGGTVTQVATGAGLAGGPILTTGTVSVAPLGITSTMVANGAIGAAQIDQTQVQARVGGTCGPTQAVQGVNQDGTVACVSAAGLSPQLLATLRWDQLPRGYGDFPVGTEPIAVAFDGANIWIANYGSGNVTKLRASDGTTLGTYTVGSDPSGLAFDGANIWVANYGSANVTKLRASDGTTLGTYTVNPNPYGLAFDGANIWVANFGSNNVQKLRPSDGWVLGTFAVGTGPEGVAFDGANIWVANYGSANVTKLRASDGTALGTYTVGSLPSGLAFDGANIWVAIYGSANVTKLRASDGTTLGTFTVGMSPTAVAFDGANVWVTNWGSGNNVTKLLASDGTTLGTFTVGTNPKGVAFDGANIWVANFSSNTVSKR